MSLCYWVLTLLLVFTGRTALSDDPNPLPSPQDTCRNTSSCQNALESIASLAEKFNGIGEDRDAAISSLLKILESGRKQDRLGAAKVFEAAAFDKIPTDAVTQKRLIQIYWKSKGAIKSALDSSLKRMEVTGVLAPEAAADFAASVKNGKPGPLLDFVSNGKKPPSK